MMMTTLYSMQVRMVTTIQMMMTAFYITISIHDDDQGRRPNNEDRAAHQKVSCPWEGVRPVHIFTVRSMLLCIFRLYYLLSTFHFHRETIFFFEFSFPLFIVHRDPFFFQFFFFIIFVNISVKGFGRARWDPFFFAFSFSLLIVNFSFSLLCLFLLIILANKVLDGHGGHFAADWVKDHLLEVKNIRTCEMIVNGSIIISRGGEKKD